jgi:hypothetical protein
MVYKMRFLTALSALALAVGGFGVTAQAAKARCTSQECACEQALRRNTVAALEDFLKKYPRASEGSACIALAVPLSDEGSDFDSQDQDNDNTTTPPDSGSAEG